MGSSGGSSGDIESGINKNQPLKAIRKPSNHLKLKKGEKQVQFIDELKMDFDGTPLTSELFSSSPENYTYFSSFCNSLEFLGAQNNIVQIKEVMTLNTTHEFEHPGQVYQGCKRFTSSNKRILI